MCGRYYIDLVDQELRIMVDMMERGSWELGESLRIKTEGEIFPTDIVPVLVGVERCQPMAWGFRLPKGRPVINARSETALEKPMFKDALLMRRCLIPASGYYEWLAEGKKKTRYRLFLPERPMYLAGCWRLDRDKGYNSFVILTQPAHRSIEAIHHRMPVIIHADHAKDWLSHNPDSLHKAMEIMGAPVAEPTFVRCGV